MDKAALKYKGLIAPCGMNCGVCIAHLRNRKPCDGCLENSLYKPKHCLNCSIVNCEYLAQTTSGFCYECEKHPCTRLKNLDKRYRLKYRMSMIENLTFIRKYGIEKFLIREEKRWACHECGAGLSAHRNFCLECDSPIVEAGV